MSNWVLRHDIMYWFRKDDVLSIEVEENDHKWMCQYDKVGNLNFRKSGTFI